MLRRVAVAALLLAAFLGLYALSNLTAAGQAFEDGLLRVHYDTEQSLGYWIDATHLPPFRGDVPTVVVGTLLAAGVALARRQWRTAVAVAIAPPVAVAATAVFKHVAGRPHLVPGALDTDVSYPSGHAAIAFAVTAALLAALPPRWLRWAAPLLLGWSALVAASLTSEGSHRASEVLGSGLLVAAVFLLAGAPRRELRPSLPLLAVPVVCAVVGAWNPVPWIVLLFAGTAVLAVGLLARTTLRADGRPRRPAPADAPARESSSIS